MSDFETRLREALTRGAEAAPAAAGLAEAARGRMRHRRRNVTGVLAAAFLVAAVPVGLAVVNAGDEGSRGRGRTTVGAEGAPDGMQVYSYLDATVLVPASWRIDGRYLQGDWCNGAKRPAEGPVGYIGVFDVRTEMACLDEEPLANYEPFASFSAQRQGPLRAERDGWVTENLRVGSAWLTIRTDDEAQLHAIQNTARVISGADPNGCTPTTPAMTDDSWRPDVAFDLGDTPVDRVTACGHGHILSGDAGPTLSRSMAFTGDAAQALVDLIVDQPEAAPTEEACSVSAASIWLVNVYAGDEVQQVLVRRDYCHGLGTDDGTTYRQDSYELSGWLETGHRITVPDDPDGSVSSGVVDPEAPDYSGE